MPHSPQSGLSVAYRIGPHKMPKAAHPEMHRIWRGPARGKPRATAAWHTKPALLLQYHQPIGQLVTFVRGGHRSMQLGAAGVDAL